MPNNMAGWRASTFVPGANLLSNLARTLSHIVENFTPPDDVNDVPMLFATKRTFVRRGISVFAGNGCVPRCSLLHKFEETDVTAVV